MLASRAKWWRNAEMQPPGSHTNLRRVFVLSDRHISPAAREWLAPEGGLLWMRVANIEREAIPLDLTLCLRCARTSSCDYILFDSDAPEHVGLPVWK